MEKETDYYAHLVQISLLGKLYKRLITSPVIHFLCCRFGSNFLEVGCGIGSGFLGAYPKKVSGVEINPLAVEFCRKHGLNVQLIQENQSYPIPDNIIDVCVLDNVLEHLTDPYFTLGECLRVGKKDSGLIVVVPGEKGYASDDDHKIFYDESNLANIHPNWKLKHTFSTPFFIKNKWLSKHIRQYCIVAVYKKV